MSDINVRSDAVDVEQIMRQIRARIREKRGADYTEAELQQLATVKLEQFLDPRGVRSDLIEQYRQRRVAAPAPGNYEFGETTLYETHRGLLAALRRLCRPLLKLLFNPDKITSALHIQAHVNAQSEQRLRRLEDLSYELLHNLTVEVTRLGIDVHNLKMRVESLSSRLDFDERRARSLENVVEYRQPSGGRGPQTAPRPGGPPPGPRPSNAGAPGAAVSSASEVGPDVATGSGRTEGPIGASPSGDAGPSASSDRRRRRRRRRRRPGAPLAGGPEQPWSGDPGSQTVENGGHAGSAADADEPDDDGPDSSDSTEQ